MAAGRSLKHLIGRRRVVGEEGEDDEEGPVLVEDSQSEGSVLSEAVDDGEGDASSLGDADGAARNPEGLQQGNTVAGANGVRTRKQRKPRKKATKKGAEGAEVEQAQPASGFETMADTDAMMNGLKISAANELHGDIIDFEAMDANGAATPLPPNGHPLSPVERQRREHEEYKKKRDADPAFIPNRGNFFMHDTRGQPNGQPPPPRGVWQSRGRGRSGANVGGPFSPANQMAQAERAAEQAWKHDLHDAINEERQNPDQPGVPTRVVQSSQEPNDSARLFPKSIVPRNQGQHRVISFDKTSLLGSTIIRVALPGMKAPIVFSEVPVHAYLRLPDHRPPLRRDKPVRVFVPGHTQRYIFPSTDRSFVFIPRQNRPNHQSLHRGHYPRSVGGYGYSSRRTSMYGGSMYSGSVAPSRRGSLASISRENAFSPVGAYGMPNNRPVVRLPHTGQHFSAATIPLGPLSGPHTPVGVSQMVNYPPPQAPLQHGTPTTTVHQPKPLKNLSFAGIQAPELPSNGPTEPQPFQNQLPAHMNEQPGYQQPPPPYYSPRQQYPYAPPQPQAGTPLSGIPEQAIHAPTFQPPPFGQPQYYPPYAPGQSYYYPPQAPNGYPQMPMYMAPPPQGYVMPPQQSAMPPPQPAPEQEPPASTSEHRHQQSQSGMVAHESNGMVFYVPASEAQQSEQYQPAESFVPSYAMPGLLPPTPAPENQMAYYYPSMPHRGMQDVGTAMYYPSQQ